MPIVEVDEQLEFMGLPAGTDEDLLESLIASTQTLFENETGRELAPFGVAQTDRIEIHEGDSYSSVLILDYPIASITSIVVGRDVANPYESLSPSDATLVVWEVGGRKLTRVDGGYWRTIYPSWVKVVYTTKADAPNDVKLAIKQKVAEIYLHKDKLGFAMVVQGSRTWVNAAGGSENPIWEAAVRAHRRGWFK
jgi:hypothetical protein